MSQKNSINNNEMKISFRRTSGQYIPRRFLFSYSCSCHGVKKLLEERDICKSIVFKPLKCRHQIRS